MSFPTYRLIDTHAHAEEIEDIDLALARAKDAGVAGVVCLGMTHESNQRALELAAKYSGFVFAGLGLHPWGVKNELPRLDQSLRFIDDNAGLAVAVGEIGLDYDKRALALASKDLQQSVLKQLLAIARRRSLPVSLHTRYAWKDSLAVCQESGVTKAVFHWFTGFYSVLSGLLDAGYHISATPAAEYHSEHRRAIKETPLDRLLLETDAPVEYGREQRFRSTFSDVVRSLKAVAEIKQADPAVIAEQTTKNAIAFFRLEGRLST